PLQAPVEDIAEVLLPGKTGRAAWTDTGTPPEAQGAEGSGPEAVDLLLKPALDISRGFAFRLHDVWMSYNTHTFQEKTFYNHDKASTEKNAKKSSGPLI